MKSTVEHLNPTRVKLTVEVPFDELKPHFDKAYKALAGQVRIPGFRPGKVPARILDARLGRGTILDEVVNEAVPAKYGEAVTAAMPSPRSASRTSRSPGSTTATRWRSPPRSTSVRRSRCRRSTSLAVRVDDVEVTDADIDEQVEALRDRFGTLTAVERAAADGDFVSDRPVRRGRRRGRSRRPPPTGCPTRSGRRPGRRHRRGGHRPVRRRVGDLHHQAGGRRVRRPGRRGDRDRQSVNERELPEVDDEFAQLASEFDTVDELRADLREKIRRVKRMEQATQARDKVLEALLEATEVPLPESVVEAEFESPRARRGARLRPRRGALRGPGQAGPDPRGVRRRAAPRPRSRCAPSCCWTRWPRPSRSGSARTSSPSG